METLKEKEREDKQDSTEVDFTEKVILSLISCIVTTIYIFMCVFLVGAFVFIVKENYQDTRDLEVTVVSPPQDEELDGNFGSLENDSAEPEDASQERNSFVPEDAEDIAVDDVNVDSILEDVDKIVDSANKIAEEADKIVVELK